MGNIGDLFVNIHANARGLVSGLAMSQKKLRKFSRSAGRMGRQMQTLSRGMMVLGTAVAAPVIVGIKAFADFEKSMANVSTMLDKPTKHMGAFTKGVSRMAVEYGESTDTLAAGLYDILSASIAPSEAMKVLAVSSRAAIAGMTDTATSADAITTILNSYGMAASEAGRVSDLLFTIVKRGKTTYGELAPHIGKVSSLASSAGVSVEELSAMLAILTRNGIRTEEAMTGIKAVISTFAKATPDAVAAARHLHLDLSTTALAADGLLVAMQKLTGENFDKLAEIFPNIRALVGIAPIIKDITGLEGDLKAMGDAVGNTDEAFGKMSGRASFGFGQAKQAAISLARALGEVLSGESSSLAATIKDLAQRLERWVRINGDLIRDVAASIPTFAAWTAGLWAASVALKSTAAAAMILANSSAAVVTGFGKTMRFLGAAGLIYIGAMAAAKGIQALGRALGILPESLAEIQRTAKTLELGAGDILGDPKESLKSKTKAYSDAMTAISKELEELADQRQAVIDMTEGKETGMLGKDVSAVVQQGAEGFADAFPGASGGVHFDSLEEVDLMIRKVHKRREALAKAMREADAAARPKTPGEIALAEDMAALAALQTAEAKAKKTNEAIAKTSVAAADEIRAMLETPAEAFKKQQEHLRGLLQEGAISSDVFWDAMGVYRKEMEAANKHLSDGLVSDMGLAGDALKESLRSPAEIFDDKMKDAKEMLRRGYITRETFSRAKATWLEEYRAQTEPAGDKSRQPGSIQTAIGTYKFGGPGNQSQQALVRNAASQTQHQQKIAANTQQTAAAVKNLGPLP